MVRLFLRSNWLLDLYGGNVLNGQLDLWGESKAPFTTEIPSKEISTGGSPSIQSSRPVENIKPEWKRLVRRDDPSTSVEAAKKTVKNISKTKQRILDLLSNYPDGLCDEQIARLLNMKESSAGKRRGDLVTDGLVEYCGYTRLTSTQTNAKVWRVCR